MTLTDLKNLMEAEPMATIAFFDAEKSKEMLRKPLREIDPRHIDMTNVSAIRLGYETGKDGKRLLVALMLRPSKKQTGTWERGIVYEGADAMAQAMADITHYDQEYLMNRWNETYREWEEWPDALLEWVNNTMSKRWEKIEQDRAAGKQATELIRQAMEIASGIKEENAHEALNDLRSAVDNLSFL